MDETERGRPSDAPVWELVIALPEGGRQVVGSFATHAAASAAALTWLDDGRAHRVETHRRQGERVDLIGVIGRPVPGQRGDPLQPQRNEGGIIY